MKTIKNIFHLLSFKNGDKIQIESDINSKYIGFNGTITNINLLKKTENGFGVIYIKSSQGNKLKMNGIVGTLKLKKR